MSTPTHSDNPFHGFSTRRARSPVDPPNTSDQVQTSVDPLPPLGPIPEHASTSASAFPTFPIVTPIMNPFAVGHPTGLQTITAQAPPSSGSSQRSRRSHNPFDPPVESTPADESPIPTPNLMTPIGFPPFLPPSPIPHHYAPIMTPPTPPPAPVAPPVTLQDTINMFTTAFTRSFAQVQNQLQPIVVPPAVQPPRPDPAKTKLRAPDPFDGTETSKLRSFLVQCQLNFADRPSAFATDRAKVNYAMSYLKGVALAWFEPYYLETPTPGVPPPLFMTDYDAFCEELKTNFGPSDPVGDAESKLRTLTMKSDQRIAKYVVNFNRLATQVLWGENALRYQFYTGLPDRIKDQIANVGKPATLVDLRNLAQNIDHRYWERKSEVSRETKPAATNPHKPSTSSSSSSSSWRSNTKSGSSSASTPKASSSTSKKPDISHLLSEGKLTDSERQRRIKENLCMYCGASGHMAKDCRKRNAATTPKARAADVTPLDPKPEK